MYVELQMFVAQEVGKEPSNKTQRGLQGNNMQSMNNSKLIPVYWQSSYNVILPGKHHYLLPIIMYF